MYSVESHSFQERQALLRLAGPHDRLGSLMELRAGRCDYRAGNQKATQVCRSMRLCDEVLAKMDRMQRDLEQVLATYDFIQPEVSTHVLYRERWTHPDRKAHFASVWGTLRSERRWNIAFGGLVKHGPDTSTEEGSVLNLSFRRGIWEDWPRSLPHCARFRDIYPVICSPYCATLLHEAVIHALEQEYLKNSPLTPKIGSPFCHPELTLSDDPELPGLAGSMKFDDTGNPASQTQLIHRGCFLGDLSLGRGVMRRASYKSLPLVRTTNMVIHPGTSKPVDWLQTARDCYLIAWIESGKWLPGTQTIEIVTGPVFRIHKGEPTSFFPELKLRFQSLTFLKAFLEIGDDTRLDPLVHWCVKEKQGVPMHLLSPSLLVDNCFRRI